jgi:hypothetical protein
MFGILKKRWKILEYGIWFEEIEVVERVFVVCFLPHNMMLSETETRDSSIHVGHGAHIGGDTIWLALPGKGVSPRCTTNDDKAQALLWGKCHQCIAEHAEYVSCEAK